MSVLAQKMGEASISIKPGRLEVRWKVLRVKIVARADLKRNPPHFSVKSHRGFGSYFGPPDQKPLLLAQVYGKEAKKEIEGLLRTFF